MADADLIASLIAADLVVYPTPPVVRPDWMVPIEFPVPTDPGMCDDVATGLLYAMAYHDAVKAYGPVIKPRGVVFYVASVKRAREQGPDHELEAILRADVVNGTAPPDTARAETLQLSKKADHTPVDLHAVVKVFAHNLRAARRIYRLHLDLAYDGPLITYTLTIKSIVPSNLLELAEPQTMHFHP